MSREDRERLLTRSRELIARSREARRATLGAAQRSQAIVGRTIRTLGLHHLGPAPEPAKQDEDKVSSGESE